VHGAAVPTAWLEQRLTGQAAQVIAVSRAQQRAWGERAALVENGIPCRQFLSADRQACRRRLLDQLAWPAAPACLLGAAARLVKGKGIETVLSAVDQALAEQADLGLVIAGSGPQQAAYQALAARRPRLRGRVAFLGHCPDMPSFYAALDAFVHFSAREGLPLVLLEAMAAGVAILASDIPACREALGLPGGSPAPGIVVASGESGQLARQIIRLAGDAPLRLAMGEAGRRRARLYDVALMVQKVAALYEKIWQERPVAER